MFWIAAARAFAYAGRFCVSVENLGLLSTIRVFTLYKFKVKRSTSVYARRLRRAIHFRGAADGVLSHFFYPGFRVRDSAANPVRFIIDAGANIGDETLRFRHFHPAASIVALEPEPGNFSILSRNFAQDPRVVVLQAGLWSSDCALMVQASHDSNNESFFVTEVPGPAPGSVEALCVPTLMKRFGVSEIDILKMDIEGAEFEVFDRNTEAWIDRVKVFIFECPDHDRAGAAFHIFRALMHANFDCFIQGECLVLIRRDTGWTVETNLFLGDSASVDSGSVKAA